MLAARAKEGVPPADPCISNARPTAWTRLSALLEDIAAMDCLSFAPKEIALGTAQGNSFG
jgi:hypothetical protein